MSPHPVSLPVPLPASVPDTAGSRAAALGLLGVLLAAILLPMRRLLRADAPDSFPFSQYPMFSASRKEHQWITHLLGVRADGSVEPLRHALAGAGGLNAVRRQLRRRVREGDGPRIAEQVAAAIAERGAARERGIVRVHVVRGRYLLRPFMAGAGREEFTSRLQVCGSADVPGRRACEPLRTAAAEVER